MMVTKRTSGGSFSYWLLFQWAGIFKVGGSFVRGLPFAAFTCACVRKMLPVRSAPLKSASLRSAPMKSVILRSECLRSAAMSSAPLKFAPLRSSPFSFAPIRALPRLIFSGVFDCGLGHAPAHSFLTAIH